MDTAFILFSKDDNNVVPDVEWVRRELEASGILCLTSATSDTSHLYRAQVLIIFQSSAPWRAELGQHVREAIRYRLHLLVITKPTDEFVWPRGAVQRVPVSVSPTAEDGTALVREVRALFKPRAPQSGTLRLFVYAPEQADLMLIREVASNTVRESARPVKIDITTWDDARTVVREPQDAVVCVFSNEAQIRILLGAGTEGSWWRISETRVFSHRHHSGLVHLKPRTRPATSFHESISMVGSEASVLREVLVAWFGRAGEGMGSVLPGLSRHIDFEFAEALRRYLVDQMAMTWAAESERADEEVDLLIVPPDASSAMAEPSDSPRPAQIPITQARFAAYAPRRVERGREFVLEIWAFNSDLRRTVELEAGRQGRAHVVGSKGPIAVETGATLAVSVEVPSFRVEPPMDTAIWDGMMASTNFVLCADPDARIGTHVGTATVLSANVPIVILRFELNVQAKHGSYSEWAHDHLQHIQTIFASYASADRVDVLQWARGAEVVGVNVFLDVLTLREASDWETELFRHVPTKDLFCLFWSRPASQSNWVEMEWRCGLVTRGLDYIHPVPLVDPRLVPPPNELRSKHFSGVPFMIREYEKGMGGGAADPLSS